MFSRAARSLSRRAPIALAAVGGAQSAAPNQFSQCEPDFSQPSSWKGYERKKQVEDTLYIKRSEENALALGMPSKEKQEYQHSRISGYSELNAHALEDSQDGSPIVVSSRAEYFRMSPQQQSSCSSITSSSSSECSEYDSQSIDWGSLDDYQIIKKVGRGRYSDVFECKHVTTGARCVMKMLKPVKDHKIKREIRVLQELEGGPNIVNLLDVFKDRASKTPCLIFEYIDNDDFKTLYPKLTDSDIRFYVFQMLRALEYCHAKGIMHRDLKPHNIMIDHECRRLVLIDWGLSEYYHHGRNYSTRVSSRYYKAPELLIDLPCYDYSLDMWSLGCILAGMVLKREPFFRGRDNCDQLAQITRVLGSEGLFSYVENYKQQLDPQLEGFPKKAWSKFVHADNQHLACAEALDLLERMLVYDPAKRISAREAMEHPYFKTVRAIQRFRDREPI